MKETFPTFAVNIYESIKKSSLIHTIKCNNKFQVNFEKNKICEVF